MSSNLPANRTNGGVEVVDDDDLTGLEDFDTTDFVTPRIKINGEKGVFVDSLSGAEYEEIHAVILGLVKQRILWAADIDDADAPLCKSLDFHRGMPDPDEFPWDASGFDKGATDEDGTLPCDGCALKDWGSHPKQDVPWCSEQHTLPLLHLVDGSASPATLTVQRSGIKPSKAYLSAFAKGKTPLFTVVTVLTLEQKKRGSVTYAVPRFRTGEKTNEEDWPTYRTAFRQMRDFLHTPRQDEDMEDADEDEDEEDEPQPAPPPKAKDESKRPKGRAPKKTAASKPTAKAVEVEDDEDEDDDDLPF